MGFSRSRYTLEATEVASFATTNLSTIFPTRNSSDRPGNPLEILDFKFLEFEIPGTSLEYSK